MDYFPPEELGDTEQPEIQFATIQYLAGLLLRLWEEAFQLFINYLHKIPTSPLKHLDAFFARKKYQKDKGDLSRGHIII